MRKSWATGPFIRHVLVTCAVIGLLLSQFAGARIAHRMSSDNQAGLQLALTQAPDEICDAANSSDHNNGAPHHGSECCVAPKQADDLVLQAVIDRLTAIIVLSPERAGPRRIAAVSDPVMRQAGWLSSWSALAPPRA